MGRSLGFGRRNSQCLFASLKFLKTKLVDSSCERYSEEHTEDPEKSAADCYRGKNPHSGQTYRRTDYLGVDEVALDLLENDEENKEDERLHGIFREYHECTYSSTDESSDNRYKSRNSDESSAHAGVGEFEYGHAHKAQRAEDYSLNELSDEETSESIVRGVVYSADLSVGSLAECNGHDPFHVRVKLIFAQEQISCENKSENEVGDGHCESADDSDRGA